MYDQGLISFNEITLAKYLSDKEFKVFFYTNRKKEAESILPSNVKVISGKIGCLIQLMSKYVFVEQNYHKWICKKNKRQIVVQLWHGLPVKKAGYPNKKSNTIAYHDLYTYVLAPSEYGWGIMKECFGYDDSQKLLLGSPRLDDMYDDDKRAVIEELFSENYILWMPTFRKNCYSDSKEKKAFPLIGDEDIRQFDKWLGKYKVKVIIKLHSLNEKFSWFYDRYENVQFLTNDMLSHNDLSVYNVLGCAKALITDYSSVVVDYLCLDKGIIFTADDIDEFKEKRGLMRTYDLVKQTGAIVKNLDELENEIENVMTSNDCYKENRKKVATNINLYRDNCNCERLMDAVRDS